jgi:hypothetical protein
MVPKLLAEKQTQIIVKIFQDLLERQNDILDRVITGDETWVYQYDPETKRQIAQCNTVNYPPPKHYINPNQRSMLLTFLY